VPYTETVRRVAIVEYLMSAGGVERVLRGLARAFLDIPEARDWDITFLLSRYNSAHLRCDWPSELTGSNVRVEWLGEENALSRALDPLANFQGILGLRTTRIPLSLAARTLRSVGPRAWRAYLGERAALVSRASERFDLLYFTYPFWMSVPPLHGPVATTPQDFNFKHFVADGTRARRFHEEAMLTWLERSDRLLLSSHAVEAELRHFYPAHASKARVVPLGVDVGREPPTRGDIEALRRRHRLPSEFAIVTGWIAPHKNQLAAVEALANLRTRGLLLPIVFVGPNSSQLAGERPPSVRRTYVDDVRETLVRGGLQPGIDFFALGYVSDADMQALFHMATLFVCPSSYEGFGLPGLEAMLAGCPVLLSSIPPFEEQNRLLGGIVRTFDPKDPATLADQIAWVLAHREEATAAARLAAQRVPRVYDWKKTARAYLAAFEEIIATR